MGGGGFGLEVSGAIGFVDGLGAGPFLNLLNSQTQRRRTLSTTLSPPAPSSSPGINCGEEKGWRGYRG